jgi:malic enzyme
MESYVLSRDADGTEYVEVELRGRALLSHPMYNKGTAFTEGERGALGLVGLLPPTPAPEELQLDRAYRSIVNKADPLEQYIGLAALQDRNEILFFRLMLAHLEELAPIVYTPTVGLACQRYSHIFRRGRGMWITPEHEGRIHDVLGNALYDDVRLIVATDNERILGLGDQGAGGMGIPIGKLVLYTVGAGIHPTKVLPVSLDVGTDNQALLADPLYLGWRHPRLRGERYARLVDEFVAAVKRRFPRALLQWEDFKKATAFELLDRYRERILSFNDDIQGTAAVALAGVMAAARKSGVPMRDQRVVILGAGAAGIGIARQLRDALQRAGVSGEALVRAIAILDSRGLLVDDASLRDAYKKALAWPPALVGSLGIQPGGADDLVELIDAIKPTVLIGTSGQPGAFTEAAVVAMTRHCRQPAIFPFSNPTANSEAHPADLIRWSDGRALIATGSPFAPVSHAGKTHRVGQGNNVYIFPGVGLGALCAGATRVTDSMFTVAAEALAAAVAEGDLAEGSLYPRLSRLREITAEVAVAVIMEAGRAGAAAPRAEADARRLVADEMWSPRYPRLRPR